ncbi:uncharacterized protein LOC133180470 [Saccostrea echinata]|nr:uncharacterized protein LOC133180470 [Saccostrea echinata]
MSIDEKSSLDDVYNWLIGNGISIETSSIFKDNEVDGFSLINMKESDIFLMIPGKVGPARKICTLIEKIRRNEEKSEQNIEGYRIIEYKEDSAGCKTIEIEPTTTQSANDDPTPQPIGGLQIYEVPVATLPEIASGGLDLEHVEVEGTSFESSAESRKPSKPTSTESLEQYIPSYSPVVRSLLEKGEIYKEWDKMIEETAYHVLSVGNFETKGIYTDFGRLMYSKFPCIGHSATKDPWGYFNKKLSQKVRHIRWRWNARGKAVEHTAEKKPKVCLKKVSSTDERMTLEEAENVLMEEFKKPTKLRDNALIAKTQRDTLKQRRLFIEKRHGGSVEHLIKKFPFLGKAAFIEKEFFLIKQNLKKDAILAHWDEVMRKVSQIFMEENSDSIPEVTIKLLNRLEESIKYKHGTKQLPLITSCKASEWKGSKTKHDDPPRLVAVLNQRNEIQNMYIVGAGQEVDTNVGILRDGLLRLIYSYYAWDLSYPKHFQLLGFLQHYILEDRENKFFVSQNYMKFCKRLDATQ